MGFVYDLFNGVGHMWFLPMLFWCYILFYIISMIHNKIVQITIVVFLAISLRDVLYLRFELSCYFFLFFYIGYYLQFYKDKLRENLNIIHLISIWVLFLIVFYISMQNRGLIDTTTSSYFYIDRLFTIVYSLLGSISLYFTSLYITKTTKLPSSIIRIGSYCMGIYIFQQFILKFIYYKTDMPLFIGNIVLPWLGFIVTALLSIVLTILLRKTYIGRKLV